MCVLFNEEGEINGDVNLSGIYFIWWVVIVFSLFFELFIYLKSVFKCFLSKSRIL